MRKLFLSLLLAGGLVSCQTSYQAQSVQYKDYRINQPAPKDDQLNTILKPYSDSVNKSMNQVIAVSSISLEKKQPEGTLNNVLADAMMWAAVKKYKVNVDAAFFNYGGIRLPSLAQGNITRGKVFELSPFDNIIVLLKLNGKTLHQVLDLASGRGGWPVAGISWEIKDKKAINIMVQGKPFDESAIYTIATIDYVANGGDDCDMLKVIPQQNNGYLFRDAIIEYFTGLSQQGKQVTSSIQNRIINAQ